MKLSMKFRQYGIQSLFFIVLFELKFTKMKKILSFTICTILLIGCKTTSSKETKPNIIFILADDFGYMDVQGYAQHTTGKRLIKCFTKPRI